MVLAHWCLLTGYSLAAHWLLACCSPLLACCSPAARLALTLYVLCVPVPVPSAQQRRWRTTPQAFQVEAGTSYAATCGTTCCRWAPPLLAPSSFFFILLLLLYPLPPRSLRPRGELKVGHKVVGTVQCRWHSSHSTAMAFYCSSAVSCSAPQYSCSLTHTEGASFLLLATRLV